MMGSDMNGSAVDEEWSRRRWLSHCTVLAGTGVAGASLVAAARADTSRRVILVVGDSLSAEYGLMRGSGWVALLEQRLARERISARLVNASISGDTTSGGRSRLGALLREHRPTHVIIELGGNDALRGLPLDMTRDNLVGMVRAAAAAGARVVVVGMQVPPNYGRKYSEDFAALFTLVAKQERAALVPFLLKGVADGPQAERLFQGDRIHPTEAAQPLMLDNVWPILKATLSP
jgi:acyl-CoA thioesterase I